MEGRLTSEGRIYVKATKVTMSAFAVVLLCCVLSPAQTQSAKPLPNAPSAEAARKSLEKAAAAGDAQAAYNLGVMYRDGQGAPQDYQKARQWFDKAKRAGYAKAMLNLGTMYVQGQGAPQDYQKAKQWFEKASAAGN